MVAPSSGVLKGLIDNIATELDTVDDLRVYKYAASSVSEFRAAIIRDIRATAQSVVAAYWPTSPPPPITWRWSSWSIWPMKRRPTPSWEKYVSKD